MLKVQWGGKLCALLQPLGKGTKTHLSSVAKRLLRLEPAMEWLPEDTASHKIAIRLLNNMFCSMVTTNWLRYNTINRQDHHCVEQKMH